MKLRYYLRGLGIGMLVAALILILSGNTGGRMSDEAIKQRAMQLGMVEKDKSVLEEMNGTEDLAEAEDPETDSADGDAPSESSSSDAETEEGAGQVSEDGTAQEEGADLASQDGASQTAEEGGGQENGETPAQSEEQALAEEIEQRAEEVAERGKEVAENSVPVDIVTFAVVQGDTSISVARRAQEMGLVKSAADFDVFLCQNAYDKRIAIGSYEITVGMTEKEIADILTRSARR